MGKVAVGHSIARGYAFCLGRFFSILGLSWLPAALFSILTMWWLSRLGASVGGQGALPAGAGLRILAESSIYALCSLLLIASISVALCRSALGEREHFAAHFVVGMSEMKLFGAIVRLTALTLAALLIGVVGSALMVQAGLIHALAAVLPDPKAFSSLGGELWLEIPLRFVVAVFVVTVASTIVAMFAIRFGFFLAPIVAAEGKARLWRAAALSRGNFWRLFVIVATCAVPAFVAARGLDFLLLGAAARASLLRALATGAPKPLVEILAAHSVVISIVDATALVAVLSLLAGASSAAYLQEREGLPERARQPAPRTKTPADRETPSTLGGPDFAPAFASVHPLATLHTADASVLKRNEAASMTAESASQEQSRSLDASTSRQADIVDVVVLPPSDLAAEDAPKKSESSPPTDAIAPASETGSEESPGTQALDTSPSAAREGFDGVAVPEHDRDASSERAQAEANAEPRFLLERAPTD